MYIFRSIIVVDPTVLEENIAEAHLHIGINSYRELCGLHLGGKTEVDSGIMINITKKAADRAANVVKQIKDVLEKDKEAR